MDNLEEMDKFLEKYNFSKLNQEEIENLNMQPSNSLNESITRKFAKVLPGTRHLQDMKIDKEVQAQSPSGLTRGAHTSCEQRKCQQVPKGH